MPRLPPLALAVLLLAGCVTPAPPEGPSTTPPSADAAAPDVDANATAPEAVGERLPPVMETFLFAPGPALVLAESATPAEARVPDPHRFSEFAASPAKTPQVFTWVSAPFSRPFEMTAPFEITLTFVSDAPGATATKPLGFPTVGGWIGTEERWAHFVGFDAPDTIEPDKPVTVRATVEAPKLFVRAGESLVMRTFLAYHVPPHAVLAYVTGGPDVGSIRVPHEHFEVAAPVATVLVEERGTTGPHPGFTTDNDPQSKEVALEVPPGAVYVVVEAVGAPTQGNYDLDLRVSRGGTLVASGTGPTGREVVVLGPGQLAEGRSFVLRVGSASAAGGSWTLVATAYAPAAEP